jgi:flavin-dependent dehydrogenase
MLLAQAGARVLLVDRASFPSDTISGHAIKPLGVAYLRKWGLLDAVLASGAPPINKLEIAVGTHALPLPEPDGLEPPLAIAPRRTILDMLLIDAAAAAGADVQLGTSVSAILTEGEHVVGIEAPDRDGRPIRARAPIVIGADGKHSYIAGQVGAEFRAYQRPVSIAYYTYWSGATLDGGGLYFAPGCAAGMLPTNHDQVLAFVQVRWSDRHWFRRDPMANYLATLQTFPAIQAALADASHDDSLRGMLDLPGFFRHSYGPGWALAGDAAHHKDPIVARGISDAFRDADLLARAIVSGLGGETDLQPVLAAYQNQREATSQTLNLFNHRLAEFPTEIDLLQGRLVALLQEESMADAATLMMS